MLAIDHNLRSVLSLACRAEISDADWTKIRKCVRAICENRTYTPTVNRRGTPCLALSPHPAGLKSSPGAMADRPGPQPLVVAQLIARLVQDERLSVVDAALRLAAGTKRE